MSRPGVYVYACVHGGVRVHANVCVDSNHIYVLPSLCVGGFFFFLVNGQYVSVMDGGRKR